VSSRFARAAVIAASLVGVAACTTAAEGNPIPDRVNSTDAPTSEAPVDDELPSDGAPKVENPIDAIHFEQNPCDVLTPEQANTLNVDPEGTRADISFGSGCLWRNPESGGGTIVSFLSKVKDGLSDTYRSYNRGEFKYFEPIEDLEGFPAVAWATDTEKPTRDCSITVGITDQLAIQTKTELSRNNVGHKDPCEAGTMATGKMLETMKAAS
jgi:hypothetical protein